MRAVVRTLLVAVLALVGVTVPPATAAPPKAGHTVTYDGYSFLVDGNRTYLWSGEFHSYRLPSPDLWLDIFQKMKAAGFNSTSLYFDWGYHSPRQGVYDFSGVRAPDPLVDMAAPGGPHHTPPPGPPTTAQVHR